MARIEWNAPGTSIYENGIDRGVLYPRVGPGVPWNGLVGVDEKTDGGDHTPYYFDGVKYLDYIASEHFQAEIEAFNAPVEFNACDGIKTVSPGLLATQQPRARFSFSYRTLVSTDLDPDQAYKLHLVYNAMTEASDRAYSTLTKAASAPTRSWTVHTIPPLATTYKPTAHFVIDSRFVSSPWALLALEDVLYGTSGVDPVLPTVAEVVEILEAEYSEPEPGDVITDTILEPI